MSVPDRGIRHGEIIGCASVENGRRNIRRKDICYAL